jgi:hypothetical protein
VILGWIASAWAADEPTAQGYVEARGQYLLGVDQHPWLFVERVRPEATVPLHERLALTMTVEAALAEGRNLYDELEDHVPFYTAPTYANETFHVSEVGDYLSVERLYLDAWLPFMDVRLGRQAIDWGSAFLVNPTDPFPEVLLTEPWRERAGVDAARVTVPVGERHQLQAVAGIDDAFRDVRAAGRATANFWKTDFSLVGAYREHTLESLVGPSSVKTRDGLVGLDVRGTAGVGFWLEGAWHLEADPYEEVAVGIDYSFAVLDGLVVQGQYYRNGAGSPEASFLDAVVPSEGDPFAPVFHGRDYAMVAASLVASVDFSGSAVAIQNLGDGTALVVPTLTWTPNGWLDVSGSAQLPFSSWGDGGELHPTDEDLVIEGMDLSGLLADATFTLWTRVSF